MKLKRVHKHVLFCEVCGKGYISTSPLSKVCRLCSKRKKKNGCVMVKDDTGLEKQAEQ